MGCAICSCTAPSTIGPLEGHHCPLDLAGVDRLWFDAEALPCLGMRLNQTIWFLAMGDCGDTHRPEGLFGDP